MGVGRRGHVDGVHLRVLDQLVGIVVPTRYVVSSSVVSSQISVSPHHRNQLGSFRQPEAGPLLRSVTFPTPMIPHRTRSTGARLVAPVSRTVVCGPDAVPGAVSAGPMRKG